MKRASARVRLGAVIAIAVLVAFVLWLVLRAREDEPAPRTPAPGQTVPSGAPAIVSLAELQAVAARSRTPIYWAGKRPGRRLEFRRTPTGRLFVRYLPAGEKAGVQSAEFLTVGTYPVSNAYAALRVAADRPGVESSRIDGGGLVVGPPDGQSVHLAFRDRDVQIEVFATRPGSARRLALDGAVRPVADAD